MVTESLFAFPWAPKLGTRPRIQRRVSSFLQNSQAKSASFAPNSPGFSNHGLSPDLLEVIPVAGWSPRSIRVTTGTVTALGDPKAAAAVSLGNTLLLPPT